jgi:hypothetical protein
MRVIETQPEQGPAPTYIAVPKKRENKMQPVPEDVLGIPLYHGTSSLFLNSIVRFGLGGRNLIAEWNVLEFAKIIYPLVEEHFWCRDDLKVKVQSFKWMMKQKSAAMNFQHGDTYLSPSVLTAIRYAANNRYGSELLTYTLDFLDELIRLKVDGVSDKLYRAYPHLFEKLDVSPAPLLIQVDGIVPTALAAENGADAAPVLKRVYDTIQSSPRLRDVLLQQTNFRLRTPVLVTGLKVSFINVASWNPFEPEYSLHSLSTRDEPPDRT